MRYPGPKHGLSQTKLIVLTAIFLTLTGNITFLGKVLEMYPWSEGNFGFLLSIGIGFAAVLTLLMTMLSCIIPARIVVSVFIILAAIIGYFADQFGAVVDTVMIQNVLETDTSEAADLLNAGLIMRFIFTGIIPAAAIWLWPFAYSNRLHELQYKAQSAAGAIAIILLCVFSFSDSYAGLFRLHKPLRYYSNPTFALYSIGKFLAATNAVEAFAEPVRILEDAEMPGADPEAELIIMVVGETARANRFSLNGYTRDTNPELEKEDRVVSYTHISACGTSTAISVPCMFALDGRDQFDRRTAENSENVLDVLMRAGVNVLWRDNNSGSKGVANRVTFENFTQPGVNPVCDAECRDVGMLSGLQEYIDAQSGDILIVLHQMGNHGPAYFKRYPPEFERFTPACGFEELSRCTDEEIGNAYDNAILYTDYFLSEVISLLKANTPRFETAMLYVSDHGESLGEHGLYLHGMPYALAPVEQTDVPVIVWIGDSSDIELSSALSVRDQANSHDTVFHSLLSAFEIAAEIPVSPEALFVVNERED